MQIYLNAIFNHFRALQAWAADKDAKLALDVKTFEIEVKFRGRYYTMHPMFQARADGRAVHSSVLTQNTIGFGGWRPYPSIRHPYSTDKRLFKSFLRESGLSTPASVPSGAAVAAPDFDYILKGAVGSFGKEIAGPFRAGSPIPDDIGKEGGDREKVFVEAYIHGRILKVWFWGGKPFFAHAHDYPLITGDGVRTVERLVRDKATGGGQDWDKDVDRDIVMACLRFQDVDWHAVLPVGQTRWIDYRYSQRYERNFGVTPHTDNALPELVAKSGDQTDRMGTALVALLRQAFPVPVMISVDGMLDEQGNIWWLEMNTNSIVPPEAYAAMFSDLFY